MSYRSLRKIKARLLGRRSRTRTGKFSTRGPGRRHKNGRQTYSG